MSSLTKFNYTVKTTTPAPAEVKSAPAEKVYNQYEDPDYYLSETVSKLAQKFKSKPAKLEKMMKEAQTTITKQFLQRNICKTSLCKQMKKKLEIMVNKKYTIISGPDEHSYVTFRQPVSKDNKEPEVEKKRLCMSNFCNYAHTQSEVREKICIYNKFNCCTLGEKCKNDHSTKDVPKHFMLKEGIEYVEDNKKICKVFFYLHEIRIFKYAEEKKDEKTYVITINDDLFVETSTNTQDKIDAAIDNIYSNICQNANFLSKMSETDFSSLYVFTCKLIYTKLYYHFINEYNNTNEKLPTFAITLFEKIQKEMNETIQEEESSSSEEYENEDVFDSLFGYVYTDSNDESNCYDLLLDYFVEKFNVLPEFNNNLDEYLHNGIIRNAVLLHNSNPIDINDRTFYIQKTNKLRTLSIDDVKITSFYQYNMYYHQDMINQCIDLLKSIYGFLYQDILGFYFCNREINVIANEMNHFIELSNTLSILIHSFLPNLNNYFVLQEECIVSNLHPVLQDNPKLNGEEEIEVKDASSEIEERPSSPILETTDSLLIEKVVEKVEKSNQIVLQNGLSILHSESVSKDNIELINITNHLSSITF